MWWLAHAERAAGTAAHSPRGTGWGVGGGGMGGEWGGTPGAALGMGAWRLSRPTPRFGITSSTQEKRRGRVFLMGGWWGGSHRTQRSSRGGSRFKVQGLSLWSLQGRAWPLFLWMLVLLALNHKLCPLELHDMTLGSRDPALCWDSSVLSGLKKLCKSSSTCRQRRARGLRNAAFPYVRGFQHHRNRPGARCSSGWTRSSCL